MNDIIQDGVIMAVTLFIIIMCYIFLSGPFATIMNTFDDINQTESDAKVEQGTNQARLVFGIIFGGLGCIPLIWFILRVMKREPDWGDL